MPLPHFICIGTQKAGTTTLHAILKQHPDIFLPPGKEAYFFNNDKKYGNGLAWYEQEYFGAWAGQKVVGEITPDYMYFPQVAHRIFSDLGSGTKFIVILRDPANRAYSHYLMSARRGIEKESFQKALSLEEERIKNGGVHEKIHFSYISRGLYCEQIARYLSCFPRKNFLFLVFEHDIVRNIGTTVDTVLRFLDLPPEQLDAHLLRNQATTPRSERIRDLIYGTPPLKKTIQKLIPFPELRSRVARWLTTINSKPHPAPHLDKETHRHLITTHFLKDITKLEDMIEKNIGHWYQYE